MTDCLFRNVTNEWIELVWQDNGEGSFMKKFETILMVIWLALIPGFSHADELNPRQVVDVSIDRCIVPMLHGKLPDVEGMKLVQIRKKSGPSEPFGGIVWATEDSSVFLRFSYVDNSYACSVELDEKKYSTDEFSEIYKMINSDISDLGNNNIYSSRACEENNNTITIHIFDNIKYKRSLGISVLLNNKLKMLYVFTALVGIDDVKRKCN